MNHDPYEDAEWREFVAQQDKCDRHVGIAFGFAALAITIILVCEHWDFLQSFLPN